MPRWARRQRLPLTHSKGLVAEAEGVIFFLRRAEAAAGDGRAAGCDHWRGAERK